MKQTSAPKYYGIASAAAITDVSTDTIRRLIARGELKAAKFGGQIRIRVEDLEAAMRPVR